VEENVIDDAIDQRPRCLRCS